MRDFHFIALTLPALTDPSVAIAASRAGGIGVLDLEYAQDDERAALAAIAKLDKYVTQRCGIRLDGNARRFVYGVTAALPPRVNLVILVPTPPDCLRQQIHDLRSRNLTVLLEATCSEEALLGEQVGVDGLIAKGHEAGGRVGDETSLILLQRLMRQVCLPIW